MIIRTRRKERIENFALKYLINSAVTAFSGVMIIYRLLQCHPMQLFNYNNDLNFPANEQ